MVTSGVMMSRAREIRSDHLAIDIGAVSGFSGVFMFTIFLSRVRFFNFEASLLIDDIMFFFQI